MGTWKRRTRGKPTDVKGSVRIEVVQKPAKKKKNGPIPFRPQNPLGRRLVKGGGLWREVARGEPQFGNAKTDNWLPGGKAGVMMTGGKLG